MTGNPDRASYQIMARWFALLASTENAGATHTLIPFVSLVR
jgi:hypothetical protein